MSSPWKGSTDSSCCGKDNKSGNQARVIARKRRRRRRHEFQGSPQLLLHQHHDSNTTTNNTVHGSKHIWSSSCRRKLGLATGGGDGIVALLQQLKSTWNLYVNFAHRHQTKLFLVDGLLDWFCSSWWLIFPLSTTTAIRTAAPVPGASMPSSSMKDPRLRSNTTNTNTSRHARSILWALLQLHRLALDLALTTMTNRTEQEEEEDDVRENIQDDPLGFSLLQLALSMIQSIWPLSSFSNSIPTGTTESNHDQIVVEDTITMARTRRFLERCKFLLRTGLLLQIWTRYYKHTKYNKTHHNNNRAHWPKLLQSGGLLQLFSPPSSPPTTSVSSSSPMEQWQQQQQQQRRRSRYHSYVGRRTGRRVLQRQQRLDPTTVSHSAAGSLVCGGVDLDRGYSNTGRSERVLQWHRQPTVWITSFVRLLLMGGGELLYIVRPLICAESQLQLALQQQQHVQQQESHLPRRQADKNNSRTRRDENNLSNDFRPDSAKNTLFVMEWTAWWISLGLDITSLVVLLFAVVQAKERQSGCRSADTNDERIEDNNKQHNNDKNNTNKMEWNRRRMRLWLYLLRSPAWEQVTDPMLQWLCGTVLERIPIVGHWISAYWQDWIGWWKDCRLEEG